MLRFLALLWNPECESAASEADRSFQILCAQSEKWTCSFRVNGVMVLHSGGDLLSPEVRRLDGAQGVILGRVFVKRTLRPNARLEELVDCIWGRYVAFESDTGAGHLRVFRGPAGALPCFYASLEKVRVFFSDVRDYLLLKSGVPSINWPWMATLLAYPRHALGAAATGIVGIEQIQPGECLYCDSDGTVRRRLLWNPFQIAISEPIEEFSAAIATVRSAAQCAVWSWAACYPRIVLLLSGGLDSSIVLNCLCNAPSRPRVECLTYFSKSCVTGDERAYARQSAKSAGVPLRELEERAADTDLSLLLRLAKYPVPWTYLMYVRRSGCEGRVAAETGARAIFSGAAGDQIFFYGPAVMAAADLLRQRGFGPGFWRYSLNIARRNKLSLWSVLSASVRDRFVTPRYDPSRDIESPNQLTTKGAYEEADNRADIRHYWMPFAAGVPHGKLLHVMMTHCPQDAHDPFGSVDYPERIMPLNSQPLIEACLRVPTYILTHAGWSRAAARAAFADELPAQTVSRMSKGYIDSQNAELLECNLAWVRELLLDGQLVAQRLIDRRKLEALLTREQIRLSPVAGEILCEHLSYEAWLRDWTPTRPS
jgi:asparagine synthase (glutamine-hydrolysing)